MMLKFFSIIFLLGLINCSSIKSNGQLTPLIPSENYTNILSPDSSRPQQYVLLWKLLNNDEIQFEIHCNTTGWVGFGLSPDGEMAGSDIAIGNCVYL